MVTTVAVVESALQAGEGRDDQDILGKILWERKRFI